MAMVMRAYLFALDVTPGQRRALASHCGAARVAYNWGLRLVEHRLEQRHAGRDVEVPLRLPALRREWNRSKQEVAPWWRENSKEAYSSGLDGLARALKNWADSRAGRRGGRPVGFPRPKRKGRARDACRFTTGPLKVLADRKHVQLPRLGVIKTYESTRKLARRLEQGTARIVAATISRRADRWYVSFTVEIQSSPPSVNGRSSVVGVDVGIRHLAVLSKEPSFIPNPRALEQLLPKLRRLDRALSRCQPNSRRRAQVRRQRARMYARAANVRQDALHKLTSGLARRHGVVVVEKLNLAGMLHNRRLARALADAGMGELRRQLAYKTGWYGATLVVADSFYPSSKRCSGCGWTKAKLTLAQRTFLCDACALVIDRDLNAARNLARLAQSVAQSDWETPNARGADVGPGVTRRSALKREAGTRFLLGQTGIVGA